MLRTARSGLWGCPTLINNVETFANVPSIIRRGAEWFAAIGTRAALARWLDEHEYESLRQMRGSMSLKNCADPKAYERANYMKVLQSWQV